MNLKYALIFTAFGILTGCGTEKSKKEAVNPDAPSLTAFTKDDRCIDERMEKWFTEFNQLQRMGYTMHEANEKAIAAVDAALKDCQQSAQLADH
jgi:hypothetical protein